MINKFLEILKKHKILVHIFHLIPVVGLGDCMFLYPTWVRSGTFEGSIVMMVLTAIAVYVGFIGHLIWYIINI